MLEIREKREKRNLVLSFKASKTEKNLLEVEAEKLGLNISNYLRYIITQSLENNKKEE